MLLALKGFLFRLIFFNFPRSEILLVKQVLTPAFIPVTNQSHQLTGRMQCERPRPPRQFEAGFLRCAVALAVVAPVTAGHQIFPRRAPAPRPRDYMIQCKLGARKYPAAELAGVAISQQNIFSGKRPTLLGDMPVSK